MNMLTLTAQQLRHAANIKEQITTLENELQSIVGGSGIGVPSPARSRKNRMSDAGRLAIAAAQKKRWAEYKTTKATPTPKKRTMSAAAKAKIARAARLRWKKAKAAGKKTL